MEPISIKIDVTKIDKDALYKGEKAPTSPLRFGPRKTECPTNMAMTPA